MVQPTPTGELFPAMRKVTQQCFDNCFIVVLAQSLLPGIVMKRTMLNKWKVFFLSPINQKISFEKKGIATLLCNAPQGGSPHEGIHYPGWQ